MYNLVQATIEDYDFIYNLNKTVMKDNVAKTRGSRDEEFQQNFFKNRFNPQHYQIIMIEGTQIGLLSITDQDNLIKLNEIQILPEYQGKGLGTELIKGIITKVNDEGKELSLQVLKVNKKAKSLYERLGFETIDANDTHFIMHYNKD